MKHPIYTEKSNISFEKYEPNDDSSCSINCWQQVYRRWYMLYQNNAHWHGVAALAALAAAAALAAVEAVVLSVEEDSLAAVAASAAVAAVVLAAEEDSLMAVASVCGGGFFGDGFHKHVIQTIHQTNDCTGNGEDQKYGSDQQDQNQKDKQVVCLNTAVNNAGHGFGADGVGNNVPSQGLGNTDDPGQNG